MIHYSSSVSLFLYLADLFSKSILGCSLFHEIAVVDVAFRFFSIRIVSHNQWDLCEYYNVLSFVFQPVFVLCYSVFDFTGYVPAIVCREALPLTKRFREDFSNRFCDFVHK